MAETKVAVLGLGYVGLPVALAFAKKYPGTVGFDINEARVRSLSEGIDVSRDVPESDLAQSAITFTTDEESLRGANFFVVAVPTPIDDTKRPDLRALLSASQTVGRVISPGATIVFESTVYPGVTEDICGPEIAAVSGLEQGRDFHLGYSPERINPGDREHTLERIVKVVSGDSTETLEKVASVYAAIIEAGVHRASSIKVAEAAKVIENTQRDLNIALMNELAIIFNKMQIPTSEVLAAAGTKWNFLRFTPGLVGGHCIGVDPYYLTTKAEQIGYKPEVILAGRRINDGMGSYIAQQCIKGLVHGGFRVHGARVGVLGVTFKENVSDIRNSRVPDIIKELQEYGVEVIAYDPHADAEETAEEYGIVLAEEKALKTLNAVIVAVAHDEIVAISGSKLSEMVLQRGAVFDVKSLVRQDALREDIAYWSL